MPEPPGCRILIMLDFLIAGTFLPSVPEIWIEGQILPSVPETWIEGQILPSIPGIGKQVVFYTLFLKF